MKNQKNYNNNDIGATPCLLHPSCFRKKAGSSGRFPQSARSAKKGPGNNGITTSVHDCKMAAGSRASGKTRVKPDFQLSTGLFSTLPAGRVGAGLLLRPEPKSFENVKNRTENPAPEPEYGLTYDIGASRNVPFVQRMNMGYSGITTSRLIGNTGKNPDHSIIFSITGLFSALPAKGKGRSWPFSPSFGGGQGKAKFPLFGGGPRGGCL